MQRKKWTPKENITDQVLHVREKKKWQIALRRYVIEKNPGSSYAKYFGLDIQYFREWIAIQFIKDLSWDNFAQKWQFDHIVPVAYFDFSNEEDLLLCWNFINIRVEYLESGKVRGERIDVMGARTYFEDLYKKTKYPFCLKMLEKIRTIEEVNVETNSTLVNFIIKNQAYIEQIATLNKDDFQRLNNGSSFKDILAEQEIARKFGGE